MQVLLTGGTGFIGSGVLAALRAGGHDVTALVRSEASGEKVAAAGAVPVRADIHDVPALTGLLAGFDGAIHTAALGDGTDEQVDGGIVDAVSTAFRGSDRPYVHTSGIWKFGSSAHITEDSPLDPPPLVAWRLGVERRLLDEDVVASIVTPGIVYGRGAGIPTLLTGAPRRTGDDGEGLTLVGDGTQHWVTVHVDDVAALYVLALEQGARGELLAAGPQALTVRELGEAASRAAGLGGVVVPETAAESRSRFGAPFARALLLDQVAQPVRSRELGWEPAGPSLVDELEHGSYVP